MKSNILTEHLLNVDLSFTEIKNKEFKKEIQEDRIEKKEFSKPICWLEKISEIERSLENINITQSIVFDSCSTIKDLPLFINRHLEYVRANNGNKTYLPYLNRLEKLCELLK